MSNLEVAAERYAHADKRLMELSALKNEIHAKLIEVSDSIRIVEKQRENSIKELEKAAFEYSRDKF